MSTPSRRASRTAAPLVRLSLSLSLLLLLLTVVGCGNTGDTGAPSGPLQVSIEAAATTLTQGETLEFTVSILNDGDHEEIWGSGSSRCRLFLSVALADETLSAGPPYPCTMDMVQYHLKPGEDYTATLQWDGTVLRDGRPQMLPPGDYDLVGRGGEHLSAPVRITLAAEGSGSNH